VSSSKIVVGIDPGAKGGVAVLGPEPSAVIMPMMARDLDGLVLSRLLRSAAPSLVVIEKSQSMPGQGVAGMFRYGMNYGKILGIVEALELSYLLVTPQAWKKQVLAGTAKDKNAAISHVRRIYPWADLTPGKKRNPHDGMADALCIAEYGFAKY